MSSETHTEKQMISNFKLLFENAPVAVIIADERNKVRVINPAAKRLSGYTMKELVGKNLKVFLSGFKNTGNNGNRKNISGKPVSAPEQKNFQSVAIKKDGHCIPVEINRSELVSGESKYKILFITASINTGQGSEKDFKKKEQVKTIKKISPGIKELEDAMQEIRRSKEHLKRALSLQQKLLDTTGAMIIATDPKGIITLINHQASLKLGYTPQEVVGRKTPVLFHSKNNLQKKRKELQLLYGAEVRGDFDVLVEKAKRDVRKEEQCIYVTKKGEEIPVSLTVTALRDLQGNITGYVGVAIDISGRMEAEKELIKTRLLFLKLLNNYPDGSISIVDKNYRFVFTGGELHKMLQAEATKLIGGELYPNFAQPLRETIRVMLEEVFHEKKHITDFELPLPIHSQVYIMDAFPLVEDDGSVNNVGVIIKNISKLKKAEESLLEALKKERSLGELKSRFVSMASHEFRTPLSTILSSAYLIDKYKKTEEQPRREVHFHRITSAVNMLTDILNEFLNIGKIEEGKIQAKFSEFNLKDFIQNTIDEINLNLKKNQQIIYGHKGNPVVNLDKSLLKHILLNLISNASKFSPERSVINVRTASRRGEIVLSVKDEGIGMSENDQKHLAERFFRGDNAVNIQGTGLGLYIVSRYAEMMHGSMKCKSEIDNGTEFILSFKKIKP